MPKKIITRKRIAMARTLAMCAIACGMVLIFYPQTARADTIPSQILDQYRIARDQWTAAVVGPARNLFWALATIEFSWTAITLLLEKSDLASWVAGFIRKIMVIGFAYTLLFYGSTWIPAIVESFALLGQNASRLSLAPGDVFMRGLNICGVLFQGANTTGLFTQPGSTLALGFAAIAVFLAFLIITVQFVCAVVESYIVVSAGFIFLGFGSSRLTLPYVERYIGLVISVGIKIMCLYLVIGLGMGFSQAWVSAALAVPGSPEPAMNAFEILGASLIYMAVCWQSPKLIAGVIGGSPAFTGGDVISSVTSVFTAAALSKAVGGQIVKWAGSGNGGGRAGPSGTGGGSGGNKPNSGHPPAAGTSAYPGNAGNNQGGSSAQGGTADGRKSNAVAPPNQSGTGKTDRKASLPPPSRG